MTRHLNDHEMTQAVAGLELEPAAAEHLASCVSCRLEISKTLEVIEARRRSLEGEAPDWELQRRQIVDHLAAAPVTRHGRRRWWTRPLLAAAAVLAAAIGLRALLWNPHPPSETVQRAEVPVEEILAEVDAVLADDSIPGLEVIDPGLEGVTSDNGAS